MIDLQLIADVLERDNAQMRTNIKQCGCHWGPTEVAKYERWIAAGEVATAALRQPSVTNDEALAALTTLCRQLKD